MPWIAIIVPAESQQEIDRCLEFLTEISADQIRRHRLPHPYMAPGLKYEREPRPRERWQTPLETLRRGTADCEDLAAYLAGWLRAHGDPNARAFVKRSPGIGYHAIVSSRGRILDPSRQLGMV